MYYRSYYSLANSRTLCSRVEETLEVVQLITLCFLLVRDLLRPERPPCNNLGNYILSRVPLRNLSRTIKLIHNMSRIAAYIHKLSRIYLILPIFSSVPHLLSAPSTDVRTILSSSEADTPLPRWPAKSGPQCPAYAGKDDSYAATLRRHGPGSVVCRTPAHAGLELAFRSTLVAPAFCSRAGDGRQHGNAADACYNWAKQNYYPLTEANTLGISGPGARWHGDRTRLRRAVSAAMGGEPLRVVVFGCSFTDGHGCPDRYFNGTKVERVTWPSRLQTILQWMFPGSANVEIELVAYAGASSFNILRNLDKTTNTRADVYIVDFSPNDFVANSKGRGVAQVTADVVTAILGLSHSPALVYVETYGYKASPFCSFERMGNCDADFEHERFGFKALSACLGREGCDFGNFTAAGCKAPCKGRVVWAPPKGVMNRCGKDLEKCKDVVLPVPAKVGDPDDGNRVRRPYVEWWAKHMVKGRKSSDPTVHNWGCEPGAAAGNIHMVSLEHYGVPVVSLQDATCDFDQCGPLSPQRYPLWPKGDAHTDCLPTHQIIADLVAGLFAAEALVACGAAAPAASEQPGHGLTVGAEKSDGATAAALAQDSLAPKSMREKKEICDAPLIDLDAEDEAQKDTPSKNVLLGSMWRFEEDVKGKFGWIYLHDRVAATKVHAGQMKAHMLVLELEISTGTVLVEFLRSYQGFGDAKCWFQLIQPAAGHEKSANAPSQLQRPEPRLLSGRWDMKVSMRDHEVFTGFWPPGRWALNVEPAENCKKFKILGAESC